ncbi:MAG: hypothetical protein DRK00_05830 [Thermoprotei archaeon]|nr:MAG: hypothetical protein DRK00_05830 [Thermoprotei archaeon]
MSGRSVKFRAVVTNISIVDSPWGEKMVKIDLSEEREAPSTMVITSQQSELARELAPVLSQVLRSMPFFGAMSRARLPRLSLYLTEEEWDRLIERPTIGDVMEVEIARGSIKVSKS